MKTFTKCFLIALFFFAANQLNAQISGAVFKDFNGNGTKDANEPFAAGVTVNAYSTTDALVATTTTTAPLTGTTNYSFTPPAFPVRVEFIVPNPGTGCISGLYDFSAPAGFNHGTSVRFVTAITTTANYAINNPAEYTKSTNPYFYTIRQVPGNPLAGSGTATTHIALEATPYLANLGTPGTTTPAQRTLANSFIGSCYGLAYSKQSGKLFTSAFIRRHNGLGTLGSGGIYMVDSSLSTASVNNFYDMDANGNPTRGNSATGAPSYGSGTSYTIPVTSPTGISINYMGATDPVSGLPLGMGVIGTNAQRNLTGSASAANDDPAAYGQTGIYGLGDLEISDDGTALYTIDLYNRKLYKLNLNSATNPTAVSSSTSFTVPNPPLRNTLGGGYATTYAGDNSQFYDGTKGRLRPFALKFYRGKLYVGAVTTGEGTGASSITDNNTGNPEYTDLWAYVFEFDPATGTWASAPIFQTPLNFNRSTDTDGCDETFKLWKNTSMTTGFTWSGANNIRMFYAQALLTGIEFDPQDESLILGFRDRMGDQIGHFQNRLDNTAGEVSTSLGEILRAYKTSSCTWELESNGKEGPSSTKAATAGANNGQGPGGGEFYYQDNVYDAVDATPNATFHVNVTQGALAIYPGSGLVMTTTMDPADVWQQGIDWFSNSNGTDVRNHAMELANAGDNATGYNGKGNGLGDMEIIGYAAPVEIGNRIWNDANGDGIQEAGEAVLTNVTVELYTNGVDGIPGNGDDVLTATVVTNTNGEYYFTSASGTDVTGIDYNVTINANTAYNLRIGSADWTGGVGVNDLAGYQVTRANKIGNGKIDLSDNDASLNTNNVPMISFTTGAAGQTNHDLDFGFKQLASLGDRVWLDMGAGGGTASDGVQNGTEPGVAGITVTLFNNAGTPIASTTTDAYGNYLFDNLAAGNYTVGFTLPANYTFTTQTNTVDNTAGTAPIATGSDVNVTTGRSYTVTLSNGENERNIDAGIIFNTPPVTQSVGDRVWLDNGTGGGTAADGIQNGTEPGVAGVTVTLYNGAGVAIATMITDANGNYLFTNVPVGTNYTVGFSLPAGMVFSPLTGVISGTTNSDVNTTTGRTGTFNVASGDNITYVDAGIYPQSTANASLGDRVWEDLDHDGVQDAGEPGIAGVTVNLYASNGTTLLATTTTDAYGYYMFTNLAPANYIVEFVKPTGYTISPQSAPTGTTATNSDANTTTGRTILINLKAGDRNTNIDAGMYLTTPPGTLKLGDKVWNDLDKDGIQDSNEPGVAGITVTLYKNGPDGLPGTADDIAVDTVSTDINGNYLFVNLAASAGASTNYNVQFSNIPNGYSFTAQSATGSTTSNDNNANGSGRTGSINLTADDLTIDAGITQGVATGKGSLGNRVWYDLDNDGLQDAGELGVAGVTVTLQKDLNGDGDFLDAGEGTFATTTTNFLGEYLFGGLDAGNYKVVFSNMPTGYIISPKDAVAATDATDSDGDNAGVTIGGATTSTTGNYILAQGEDNLTVDLGITPPASRNTLGDFVWFDMNNDGLQSAGEPGVPGVMVTLYNNVGTAIAFTSTDANGQYLFTGLADGTYSVGFGNLPAGYEITTQSGTNDLTGSDADRTSGKTTTVTLTFASGGTSRDNRSLDAGLISTRAALGNYVWLDTNGDGVQDAAEAGIPGVTVILYASDGTTVLASTITDQNGKYLFPNLNAGSYVVGFSTIPGSLQFTQQNTPGDNGNNTNSDADPVTGKSAVIVLSAGETDLTIDAGVRPAPTATVGDYVWADLNSDGIQDPNEPGIGGMIATLYNSSNVPIGSAVTNGNGYYLITNVPPGTGYYVTFTNSPNNPSGLQPSFTIQGPNGGTNTSHANASGVSNTFTVNNGDNITNIDAGIKDYPGRAILPISRLDINAILRGNTVTVNWITESELNTSRFYVERSTDNRNFTSVGNIAAGGTTYGTTNYSLNNDISSLQGINIVYYRIKAVDIDGKYTYSAVAYVRLSAAKDISIYPNPVSDVLNVALPDSWKGATISVSLYNNPGQAVYQTSSKQAGILEQVNVSALSRGIYTIRITNLATKESSIKKIEVY